MSEEQEMNEKSDESSESQEGAAEQTPVDATSDSDVEIQPEAPGKSNPEDAEEGDAEAAMLAMMEGEQVGDEDSSLDDKLADLPTADPISPDSINYTEPTAQRADFQQLSSDSNSDEPRSIDMLMDVSLPISIELGRTKMSISEILGLGPGSVVELNKLAGEPVEVLVNQKTVAFGEVVVVDENFGVRITQLMSPADRMKSLST
jgi:flagellar motor switch protein FliN